MNIAKIEDIKKIACLAGKETLKYYRGKFNVSYKDVKSPLTEADLVSDRLIRNGLKKYGFPILSEESEDDKKRLNSEYVWIVDPLDGTSDFVEKTGEFAIMIALVKKNQPVMGVIYEPVADCFYYAQENKGSYKEERGRIEKMRVSLVNDFSRMTILVSRNHLLKTEIDFFEKAGIGSKKTAGSAGLKMAKIAAGEAEIYINSSDKTSEWDTCAGVVVLQEAGGKITDMDGNDLTYNNKNPRHLRGYVASNGTRHKDIIQTLKDL